MTSHRKTVVFWGAGATADLGMPRTPQQADFLYKLAPPSTTKDKDRDLCSRVREALKVQTDDNMSEHWIRAFHELLTVLGDDLSTDGDNDTKDAPFVGHVTQNSIVAMRTNWDAGASDDEIRDRIIALRSLYDWPALKDVIGVCPRTERGDGDFRIELQDLFNVLDMHAQGGHGFQERAGRFITPQRVLGARNALQMLIQSQFYMAWQHRGRTREELRHYYDFSVALGRRMQRQGLALEAAGTACDNRDFYMSDLSFVSLNWDPIALWCQFVANRDLNNSPAVPHVGCPARKLKIFHDLGHFVAGLRVEKHDKRDTPWHPMNESSAQRLNDDDHGASDRIRIGKFLFPHGCLWWRECPNCGKLSSYMGDTWKTNSPTLLPPPPLKAFVKGVTFKPLEEKKSEESLAWDRGEVDARACVHCGTLTYMHHTPMQIQSNFKSAPPPFMEEIQRDMRVVVENADHIIFMGYSLPPDDVAYRAFFAARSSRKFGDPPKCSIVLGRDHRLSRWLRGSELDEHLRTMEMDKTHPHEQTLKAARGLFGRENVRFYGGGIPQVFLNNGSAVTESAMDQLLDWDAG